jgi:hypothetical protein
MKSYTIFLPEISSKENVRQGLVGNTVYSAIMHLRTPLLSIMPTEFGG